MRKKPEEKQPEKKKTEWEGTRRWREKRVGNFEPEGKRQTTKNIFERERENRVGQNKDEREESLQTERNI